jgi:hypothetical protein
MTGVAHLLEPGPAGADQRELGGNEERVGEHEPEHREEA